MEVWVLDGVTAWPDLAKVLVHEAPGHRCVCHGASPRGVELGAIS